MCSSYADFFPYPVYRLLAESLKPNQSACKYSIKLVCVCVCVRVRVCVCVFPKF